MYIYFFQPMNAGKILGIRIANNVFVSPEGSYFRTSQTGDRLITPKNETGFIIPNIKHFIGT